VHDGCAEDLSIHRPDVRHELGQRWKLPDILGGIHEEPVGAGFADVARTELWREVRERHWPRPQAPLQQDQLVLKIPTQCRLECRQSLTDLHWPPLVCHLDELVDEAAYIEHPLTDASFLSIRCCLSFLIWAMPVGWAS
jgi:hypothetical protein